MRSTAFRECPGIINSSFLKEEIAPHHQNKNEDIIIDFEILTDEISSLIGLALSYLTPQQSLRFKESLLFISELSYHASTALRISNTITQSEIQKLETLLTTLETEIAPNHKKIILPQGSTASATCHIIRTKCNVALRLLHKYNDANPQHQVDPLCLDMFNLSSGYFLYLAIKLNMLNNVEEVEFKSRLIR